MRAYWFAFCYIYFSAITMQSHIFSTVEPCFFPPKRFLLSPMVWRFIWFNQDLGNDLARQRKRTREEATRWSVVLFSRGRVWRVWRVNGWWKVINHKYHEDFWWCDVILKWRGVDILSYFWFHNLFLKDGSNARVYWNTPSPPTTAEACDRANLLLGGSVGVFFVCFFFATWGDHCFDHKMWLVVVSVPIPSMGLVYLPTWMVVFDGFHVGKNTIHGWMVWGLEICLQPITI